MTCLRDHEHGADLLIGYLEDTLTPEQRGEIDGHALACPDCRELLAVQMTLDEFPAPEVSSDFDARLYERIAAEEEVRPRFWSPFWTKLGEWLWRPAIPLTVAAAVVAGVLWLRPADPVEQPPLKAEAKQPVDFDAQQLEQALQDLELLMPLTGEM